MIKVFLGIVGFIIVMAVASIGLREDGGKSVYESNYGSWIPKLSGHRIVKVLDLPDTPELRREDGIYVDLGYYYHRLWGGEWVGYIGSPKLFVPMEEDTLKALMIAGHIDSIPLVPERPLMFDRVIVYGMILLVLGASLFQKFFRGKGTAKSKRPNTSRKNRDECEVDWDSVDARIRSEAKALGRSGGAAETQALRSPNVNAGFGRRKT